MIKMVKLEKELLSLKEFLHVYGMSKGTYYKLLRLGSAPTRITLQGKILISRKAAQEWVKRMESKSTQIV